MSGVNNMREDAMYGSGKTGGVAPTSEYDQCISFRNILKLQADMFGGTQGGVVNGLYTGFSNGVKQHNGVLNGTDGLVRVTIINITARESSNSKLWKNNTQNCASSTPKSLCFNIRGDDTVATLKSLILMETQSVSWPEHRVLYFQGRNLSDDRRLSDYGIYSGQVTLLMATRLENTVKKVTSSENQVSIELANKTSFKIDVSWSTDLVEDLKNRAGSLMRMSVNRFQLRFKELPMKNGERISRYLTPGSCPTIQMITDDDIREAETGNLKILVELESTGDLIPIESIHDTIAGLKHQIEIRTKIPTYCQCLVFNGEELQDGQTLRNYDLKRGNVVLLKTA